MLLLAVLSLFFLGGCGQGEEEAESEENPRSAVTDQEETLYDYHTQDYYGFS